MHYFIDISYNQHSIPSMLILGHHSFGGTSLGTTNMSHAIGQQRPGCILSHWPSDIAKHGLGINSHTLSVSCNITPALSELKLISFETQKQLSNISFSILLSHGSGSEVDVHSCNTPWLKALGSSSLSYSVVIIILGRVESNYLTHHRAYPRDPYSWI